MDDVLGEIFEVVFESVFIDCDNRPVNRTPVSVRMDDVMCWERFLKQSSQLTSQFS